MLRNRVLAVKISEGFLGALVKTKMGAEAKVSSSAAKDHADLLKERAKVKVEFDDRGGGEDVRVKSINPR